MNDRIDIPPYLAALNRAASYGQEFRQRSHPLHPQATVPELRRAFCVDLPEQGLSPEQVIDDLIAAAEPGLVGNTDPNFFAWVMGGSDPVGVAADWLTSVWGQNAGIFQTAPAAAIAEEAVSGWLLDLLDLPRESSVGFVTGATMAAFVGLAAARSEVLSRAGHDFEEQGLQGAPKIHIFISEDAHATNFAALRFLGFGSANIIKLPCDEAGLLSVDALSRAIDATAGPKIIVTQAGHINSGGFEDFPAITTLAKAHNAWVHVDGAFGLWARVLPEKSGLTDGLEQADSWSVDGHKWLQVPYDSGFAIVKDSQAHRRAMDISASYLNQSPGDGRNPTEFNPELSRRARGFAAWAVLRAAGRSGIREIVERHCLAASYLTEQLENLPGIRVLNKVHLNQVVVTLDETFDDRNSMVVRLADQINLSKRFFVRPAEWRGQTVLRFSIISHQTDLNHVERLAEFVGKVLEELKR
ncbi:aminotransferase class V-fold PLP-dependent enzyme [Aliiroseovarius sp. KMU-50]|uniref:Aminotransferase class V-fold PLP-dependent enzyme n=1 Tax=Aliiroseovarius salicola TaxID=3009082 RepID=A0ABT4VX74_9RHOB|nr:aminotransferase class V-fold PLP-dependent enzyme [Aliiroseovarius sp. KMU-50]MDA5092847.1 aminotransferase class V-fold PLP-dependent enzyme [Aliiroseovarius sp. KMU-50]